MGERNYAQERSVGTITYKGAEFEVVERPEVLWVGCVDYAENNTDESDIEATLKRYREELIDIPKQGLINPDCSASLSINYGCSDKPCGIMFAQETDTDRQDERYDVYKMSSSVFIRVRQSSEIEKILGRECHGLWELFGIIKEQVLPEYGYRYNSEIPEIEYYDYTNNRFYAYVPVIKTTD